MLGFTLKKYNLFEKSTLNVTSDDILISYSCQINLLIQSPPHCAEISLILITFW